MLQIFRPALLAITATLVAVSAPADAGASALPSGHSLHTPRTAASSPRYLGTATSRNWAGYVHRERGTTSASARWVVPRVGGGTPGHAATWVGIDGIDSARLAQVGTAQVSDRRLSATYAWWEVITPGSTMPMQPLPVAVRPGDTVAARVCLTAGTAILTLDNLSTGRGATRTARYTGPGTSAEWIQEDVDTGGWISSAPSWSPVTFRRVTRNGRAVTLEPSERLDIVDGRGVRETLTSRPAGARDQFRITRLVGGSPTLLR